MNRIKNIIIGIVIIIFSIILLICLKILIKDFSEYNEINNSTEELIEDVIIENTNKKSSEIDWEKLKQINKDIIGWIQIEDTNINYPILQDNDLYYLKHSYDRQYNSNGSIFTIDTNPFEENKTVIHGHNMKNGIMFSELSKYMNEQFFNTHNRFKIYTPDNNYEATIFSCYSINVNKEENNISLLNFDEEIEYYKNISKYSVEDIGQIDKIVKLSTCSYIGNTTSPTTQRYYIVSKIEIMP